jgi:hypothetical protein
MEPARRIELRLPAYQAGVLTVITKQAWLAVQASNLESVLIQSQAGLPVPPTANGASCRSRPGNLSLTRRLRCQLRQGGIVSPVRFERTLPSASCWCLLPLGYEDIASRHPVPTRTTLLTREGPQPCAAAKLPDKDSNLDSRLQRPPSCH